MQSTLPQKSLTSQVYELLRSAIVLGELEPGTLHSVVKLADSIQVSRSPVREALVMLSDQGMVDFERNKGVRIRQTTAHDLEEVFSLRLLIEVPATHNAAQRMRPSDIDRLRNALGTVEEFTQAPTLSVHQDKDAAFHRTIVEFAGNKRMTGVVDNLWAHQKLRGVSTAGKTRDLAEIHHDHRLVFERIEAADPEGAAAAMQQHLITTGNLLIAQESGTSEVSLPWGDVFLCRLPVRP